MQLRYVLFLKKTEIEKFDTFSYKKRLAVSIFFSNFRVLNDLYKDFTALNYVSIVAKIPAEMNEIHLEPEHIIELFSADVCCLCSRLPFTPEHLNI